MKISPFREALERLPESQPEYWREKLAHAGIDSLDGNQAIRAERIVRHLLTLDPSSDLEEATSYAVKQARDSVPTTKQAAMAVAEMRNGPTYCYLAFYGLDGCASFLKIGISNHPERRMYGIATGNPFDCLWVFAARFASRKIAYAVEQSLIRHFHSKKRRGEWFQIDGVDEVAARSIASDVGVFSSEVANGRAEFSLLGYTDGRSVA